jgi:hypothetical protein
MRDTGANKVDQTDDGHRALYVLGASLALAVMGMMAVALLVTA